MFQFHMKAALSKWKVLALQCFSDTRDSPFCYTPSTAVQIVQLIYDILREPITLLITVMKHSNFLLYLYAYAHNGGYVIFIQNGVLPIKVRWQDNKATGPKRNLYGNPLTQIPWTREPEKIHAKDNTFLPFGRQGREKSLRYFGFQQKLNSSRFMLRPCEITSTTYKMLPTNCQPTSLWEWRCCLSCNCKSALYTYKKFSISFQKETTLRHTVISHHLLN